MAKKKSKLLIPILIGLATVPLIFALRKKEIPKDVEILSFEWEKDSLGFTKETIELTDGDTGFYRILMINNTERQITLWWQMTSKPSDVERQLNYQDVKEIKINPQESIEATMNYFVLGSPPQPTYFDIAVRLFEKPTETIFHEKIYKQAHLFY